MYQYHSLVRVAQSVTRLTIPGFDTFVSPSADSRRAVFSYWRKYEHKVMVNGGLSLPRKSVVRLTDRLDMPELFTVDVK